MYMKKFIKIIVLLCYLLNINGQFIFANTTILEADYFCSVKFTSSDQINFTIPLNVNEIKVTACGENGDEGRNKGECLLALLNVKPKEVLFINVGNAASLRMGGYNGGDGTGEVNGGNAGGATTIRNSTATLLFAAGGGEG